MLRIKFRMQEHIVVVESARLLVVCQERIKLFRAVSGDRAVAHRTDQPLQFVIPMDPAHRAALHAQRSFNAPVKGLANSIERLVYRIRRPPQCLRRPLERYARVVVTMLHELPILGRKFLQAVPQRIAPRLEQTGALNRVFSQ